MTTDKIHSYLESLVGKTLDNKFCVEEKLGEGQKGDLYFFAKNISANNKKIVLKIFCSSDEQTNIERFRQEVLTATRHRNPLSVNLLSVIDFSFIDNFEDNYNPTICYIAYNVESGISLYEMDKVTSTLKWPNR